MTSGSIKIETLRAALASHGFVLRGVIDAQEFSPRLANGDMAGTVALIGYAGPDMWARFVAWRTLQPDRGGAHPLDTYSEFVIRPLASRLDGTAFFPSEKPWQPFQRWAMQAEGLSASPLGVLIHPAYGLWHGYRGAIGFSEHFGTVPLAPQPSPCETCVDKPCLVTCPVEAISPAGFAVVPCRAHLASDAGRAGCMATGCNARNACPIGADYQYSPEQLAFHMAALSI